MTKNFFHSTIFTIIALMFLLSFISLTSIFSSIFVSDNAQTDALAVNVAGSLRMQSYRLASEIQASDHSSDSNEVVSQLIETFERDLTTGVLINQQSLIKDKQLLILYQKVQAGWFESIKPKLLVALKDKQLNIKELNQSIKRFVNDIDMLVSEYQSHAEKNIASIRLIQIIALFCTVILVAFAVVIIKRNIEQPLMRLVAIAKKISHGDLMVRADESGQGELAALGKTINIMIDSIYRSQSQLEEHVKRKTKKLSQSNESLNLLFELSRHINEVDGDAVSFDAILNELSHVTGVQDLDLCLMTAKGKGPYEHLITSDKPALQKCIEHDCADCIEHNDSSPKRGQQLRYQLNHSNVNYGVLIVSPKKSEVLEEWQHKLFESFADQVANGLSLKHKTEQGRRITLMNERTVIARELHDSLAQALSYLKIQVTRLQKLQKKENAQEQIDEVVDELKGGLSSAYRELRELLTTFRLKLDGQSVKEAFEQTITQFKSRSDAFNFELNYELDHIPFTAQEEIHLLQIAREAIQNAFYHSQGDKITISMAMDNASTIELVVRDNGVGIAGDPSKLNHYGLAIMQERSRNLNGEISVASAQEGGTLVVFRFVPNYIKNSAA